MDNRLLNGPLPIDPKNNPYTRVQWEDDLVDPVTAEVLEEGTTFWAEYANNLEWGIWNAFSYVAHIYREVEKLQALAELDGRAPGNNGTFADVFDDGINLSRIERLTVKTDVTADVASGATVIPVVDASKFEALQIVTIYDANSYEDALVRSIDTATNTITVNALTSDYSKGAKIARSTASVNTVNQTLDVKPFTTYSVDLVEVV